MLVVVGRVLLGMRESGVVVVVVRRYVLVVVSGGLQ